VVERERGRVERKEGEEKMKGAEREGKRNRMEGLLSCGQKKGAGQREIPMGWLW
jgi:hypothetical protein